MSALRTLRRRLKNAHMVRDEDGSLVAYKRAKVGSFNRRIIAEAKATNEKTGVERCYRYHATKGLRKNRVA